MNILDSWDLLRRSNVDIDASAENRVYRKHDKEIEMELEKENESRTVRRLLAENKISFRMKSLYDVTIVVARQDLPRLYKVVGRLELKGKEVYDVDKFEILVGLKAHRYPSVVFGFITKLKPTDKCRFQTNTYTGSSVTLVCSK
jgi:hypothetical protein